MFFCFFPVGQSESGRVGPAQLQHSANVGNATSEDHIALFFSFSSFQEPGSFSAITFSFAIDLLKPDRFLTRSVYFNIKRGASPTSACQIHLQNSNTVPADALRLISGSRSTKQHASGIQSLTHGKNVQIIDSSPLL